jgi:hypothetical protein
MYFDNYKPHIAHLIPWPVKRGGFYRPGVSKNKKCQYLKKYLSLIVGPVKRGGFYRPGVSNSKVTHV